MAKHLSAVIDAMIRSVEDNLQRSCWKPAADIYNTPDGWLVKLDIAGVNPDDVKIEISGQKMWISGVRRDRLSSTGITHHLLEINYHCFERQLEFPETISEANLKIEMDQGMLIIWVGKQ